MRVESTHIAEEANKRHRNVMRDIRKMLEKLLGGRLKCEQSSVTGCELSTYTNAQGKEQACYLLDRRHAECLITGWDVERRMKVIDLWHRLEEEHQKPKELDRETILVMALEAEREKKALEVKLQEAKPKVEFAERVSDTEELMTMTQVAKELGVRSAQMLNKMLNEKRIIFKQSGNWMPFAKYTNMGWFKLVTSIYEKRNGFGQGITLKVTPAGRQAIHKLITV